MLTYLITERVSCGHAINVSTFPIIVQLVSLLVYLKISRTKMPNLMNSITLVQKPALKIEIL
jgi:hypothetical protein